MDKIYVYGIVLEEETVVYIGISKYPARRFESHHSPRSPCSTWLKQHKGRAYQWIFGAYHTRALALKAEAVLIKTCNPILNTKLAAHPGSWNRPGKPKELNPKVRFSEPPTAENLLAQYLFKNYS